MPTNQVDRPSDLAAAIRRRREELSLRQEDLASLSGLSMTTIRRVEAGGDTRVTALRAIAKALRTTVHNLLDDNGEAA